MKSITQAKTNLSVTTKRAIDQLTGDWGMSTSTYLRMAIHQALKERTIPFKVTTSNKVPDSFAQPNSITKQASHEKGIHKYDDSQQLFKDILKS